MFFLQLKCPRSKTPKAERLFRIKLIIKDVFKRLNIYITIELCEVSGELDGLRADLYAVLRIAATGDAAFLHEGVESLRCIELSKRVKIEEISLDGRCRTNEV